MQQPGGSNNPRRRRAQVNFLMPLPQLEEVMPRKFPTCNRLAAGASRRQGGGRGALGGEPGVQRSAALTSMGLVRWPAASLVRGQIAPASSSAQAAPDLCAGCAADSVADSAPCPPAAGVPCRFPDAELESVLELEVKGCAAHRCEPV